MKIVLKFVRSIWSIVVLLLIAISLVVLSVRILNVEDGSNVSPSRSSGSSTWVQTIHFKIIGNCTATVIHGSNSNVSIISEVLEGEVAAPATITAPGCKIIKEEK